VQVDDLERERERGKEEKGCMRERQEGGTGVEGLSAER